MVVYVHLFDKEDVFLLLKIKLEKQVRSLNKSVCFILSCTFDNKLVIFDVQKFNIATNFILFKRISNRIMIVLREITIIL